MADQAVFNLDRVRAEILSGAGLARTNRFEVVITPPPALADKYDVSYLASSYIEQASMPMLNIFTKAQKIFGPSYQRPITSEYGGEGMPITFHVDRDMRIRRFFEDWMHVVINPETFTVGYQQDYISTVLIKQLDEQEKITHEIKLLEAFPKNMNIMELNNASTNQTHRLNIIFAYRYWVNTAREDKQTFDIPKPILEPQVPRVDNRVTKPNPVPNPIIQSNYPIVPSSSFGADSPAYDTQDKSNIGAAPAA